MRKALKVAAISFGGILGIVYILFLVVPFFLNGVLNAHNADIVKLVEDASGMKVVLQDLKVVTTPKLTAGVKLAHAEISLPSGEKILYADNFEIKMSLIPLLARKIELDKISADNSGINLHVKRNGHFLIEDYIPEKSVKTDDEKTTQSGLPFGLKLSNHLPDIYINNYNIVFINIEDRKKYVLYGKQFNITDFILNKKVKISANGEIYLDNSKQFSYDVKVKNYIMPDIDLNKLMFPDTTEAAVVEQPVKTCGVEDPIFNIIDLFKAIHKNQLTANIKADVKTYGSMNNINYDGNFIMDNLSVAVDGQKLPPSSMKLNFKGKKTVLNSIFYTSKEKEEATTLVGDIKTGKHPSFNIHLLSNAEVNNIINLVDSVAKSFGINDLDTLSGTGKLDANFYVIGNEKKVTSSGFLRLPYASINYKLYNIIIDKINADVDFADNNVDIKNISFSVLNQPLKLTGTISSDAAADLQLKADKLLIKALVAAAGQMALLKENDFNSGTLSMNASLKGNLSNPVPAVDLSVDNVNIRNIPSDTTLKLLNSKVNITTDGKAYKGVVNVNSADVINPMAKIKAPEAKITIGEKDIIIDSGYILLDNSRINFNGSITDYMNKNLNIDIKAKGHLIANDLKNMVGADMRTFIGGAKGKLPLSLNITGNDKTQNIHIELDSTPTNYLSILDIDMLKNKPSSIRSNIKISNDSLKLSDTGLYTGGNLIASVNGNVNNLSKSQNLALNISVPSLITMPIPGMGSNSVIKVKGDITVGGTALNPTLKGNVTVPSLKIPDMLLSMDNMNISLNGPLANGKGTLQKLTSGGIAAENLTSDFSFNPNTFVFTLKNIKGNAFSGQIGGDVSYNVMTGNIGVDFKGSGLDAIKAIEGAAGIKNALSGTLGFTANVTTRGATDVEMIKNLKGKMSFDITDGAFLSIGRIENLLAANNVMANVIMKATVATLSTVPVVKNSANFKYIKGNMTFNGGWADIHTISTSGPSMAYYIKGKYNILNGTANLVILGRLGSDVLSVLGPVGELSVDKLTSYLPKFGAATAAIINTMTTNPKGENISAIPQLSSGNTVYKDFKVNFNGGIESKSSVKSFKWLSNPDMSEIEKVDLKQQLQESHETIKQNIKTDIENAKNIKEQTTQDFKDSVQNVKDSVDEIKNLFKF